MTLKKKITGFILLTVLLTSSAGCASSSPAAVTRQGIYFDTILSLTLYGREATDAHFDACFDLADRSDTLFSAQNPESDISHVNAAPGTRVSVDPETARLVSYALDFCEESGGRFDITIGRLSSLWNLSHREDEEASSLPDADEIERLRRGVDWTCVETGEDWICLNSADCTLDLGGIAKGWIADRMKALLLSEGVTSALINLGGNVLCVGDRPDKTPFSVGIQKPFVSDGELSAVARLSGQTAVTSGSYQRYITVDGVRYHHILDPDTGWPAQTGLDSVTVFGASSAEADALSTILFLMGPQDGLSFAESKDDIEALFLTEDGEALMTSGLGSAIPLELR